MLSRQPRPRKCAWCSERFEPRQMGQKACSPKCALAHTRAEAARKAHRAPRKPGAGKAPTDRRTALKRCQIAFNAFIRERDRHRGCVSCDIPATWQGQFHASHYRSVGAAPELRFEPLNCHKSCSACNNHKSGNIEQYRPELIRRIGLRNVEWLEGPHEPKRWTVDDLNAMAADFRRRVREMRSEAA